MSAKLEKAKAWFVAETIANAKKDLRAQGMKIEPTELEELRQEVTRDVDHYDPDALIGMYEASQQQGRRH